MRLPGNAGVPPAPWQALEFNSPRAGGARFPGVCAVARPGGAPRAVFGAEPCYRDRVRAG